jgi:FkbM family methyltransferase
VVVDVGANIGVLSLTAAGVVGQGGRVVAIEPNERIFSFLAANVARNGAPQVSCLKSAVGSSTGVLRMTDLRSDDFNAVIPDGQSLDGSARTVQSNRLDDLLDAVERIDLLKVDVEGFELPVFNGAEKVLARTECIYFECSRAHCRRYGYSPSDVVQFLEAQGFSLYRWRDHRAMPIADVGTVGAVCENLVALRHAGVWEERTGAALAG